MAGKLQTTGVVLVDAGIMSATLGIMLKELQPDISIAILERLDVAAAESSDAWNNAGIGHSAFCELNYTHGKGDGTIDNSKMLSGSNEINRMDNAIKINDTVVWNIACER